MKIPPRGVEVYPFTIEAGKRLKPRKESFLFNDQVEWGPDNQRSPRFFHATFSPPPGLSAMEVGEVVAILVTKMSVLDLLTTERRTSPHWLSLSASMDVMIFTSMT